MSNEWQKDTREDYERKGIGGRSGYGEKPALLVVDFINGFTDPTSPLGGDFSDQLEVTAHLLKSFRERRLPVVYTTISYAPDLKDGGLFIKKVPSLAILVRGSTMVEVDDRIRPAKGDYIVEKKFASSFFGTDLDTYLRSQGVDTIVMTGCTTSGCIRASAIDSMQSGYHAIVVRDGVGDRAEGPHEANLFDIDAKYGDVISAEQAEAYLTSLGGEEDMAADAASSFQHWWADDQSAKPRGEG